MAAPVVLFTRFAFLDLFEPQWFYCLKLSLLAYTVLTFCLYIFIVFHDNADRFSNKSNSILLITAHPDDECMFFSPTLIGLVKNNSVSVSIVCITSGLYSLFPHAIFYY